MAIKVGTTAFDLIMRYARKRLATPNAEGIMEVMSNKQAMDFVKDLVEEFNRFGVPESAITVVDDVGKFANQIMDLKQQQIMQAFKKQITPKKSAQVFDLQGNKIDTSKGIIGGRQIPETEAQIKTKIEKGNKKGIARLRQQKMVDDAIDNSSPGFSGDTKYDAQLVADDLADKMYGKEFYDLSQKQQSDIYGQAYDGLAKQRFKGLKKPEPEDMATGGRAGFDKGGMSRRKFMQIMGGLAALPVVGKFFKTGKVAAPVVEKAAEAASGVPSYFFDLVNKIKIFGKEGRSISPRKKTTTYKNYELEEDLTTGDLVVVKQKGDPDFAYEEEVMSLRKGQADEMTKGKTPPDEYEELTVRPDGEGKMKDVEDGIEPESIQEIVKEVSGEAPSIKKAGGGIARMLGE
tara:strand:- start:455 stop:1666 length:1212 start_codon:yes stop_codon:yes gene_type:complete